MGGEETQLPRGTQDSCAGSEELAEEGTTVLSLLASCAGGCNSCVSLDTILCVQAQAYLVAHHQAIKLFRGKAHPTLQQRQEAAYKKALAHEHPGPPPVAVETAPSALPDDDMQVHSSFRLWHACLQTVLIFFLHVA